MQDAEPLRLLDADAVAALLDVGTATLARWRSTGIGPRFVRLGRPGSPVRYRRSDVAAWVASRTLGTI